MFVKENIYVYFLCTITSGVAVNLICVACINAVKYAVHAHAKVAKYFQNINLPVKANSLNVFIYTFKVMHFF